MDPRFRGNDVYLMNLWHYFVQTATDLRQRHLATLGFGQNDGCWQGVARSPL